MTEARGKPCTDVGARGERVEVDSCTYRAFLRLQRERQGSDVWTLARPRDDRRTEHLEGLPYRLLVEDMTRRVRVITVLDTLHVLKASQE